MNKTLYNIKFHGCVCVCVCVCVCIFNKNKSTLMEKKHDPIAFNNASIVSISKSTEEVSLTEADIA